MSTTIPDLWSEDIKVDILTPLAILRSQESYLERKTQGLLKARVLTTTGDGLVQHQLDLIAPTLNDYRTTLLTARHDKDRVYPVTIRSEGFLPFPKRQPSLADATKAVAGAFVNRTPADQREASTQDELIKLVQEALHSGYVRSLLQSLIAQSNEARLVGNGPEVKIGD